MKKKIIKHGKHLAVELDKKIITQLNIQEDDNVEIRVEDGKIIIEPVQENPAVRKKEIKKIGKKVMREYSELFKKLSKT